MTLNDTFSNLTMISVALGIFFMSAAFYKSIFHKRRSPARDASFPSIRPDEAVRLGDPFQPLGSTENRNEIPFPGLPPNAAPAGSAFRQIPSVWDGATSCGGAAKNETYEWE